MPVSELTFTAFDFETTGLSSERDRIVEFGAVRVSGGELTETFHALVNPGIPIPAEASAVHGITDERVAAAPLWQDVLPEFVDFVGKTVLFAHNAPFDMGFYRTGLRRLGRPDHPFPVVDTLQLARGVFPGLRSYSLQNLATWLGLPKGEAHSALDDAILCARLFQVCIIRKGDERLLTLAELGASVPLS